MYNLLKSGQGNRIEEGDKRREDDFMKKFFSCIMEVVICAFLLSIMLLTYIGIRGVYYQEEIPVLGAYKVENTVELGQYGIEKNYEDYGSLIFLKGEKVLFKIPKLGFILSFMKNPVGFIFLIVLPISLIIIFELTRLIKISQEKKVYERRMAIKARVRT